MTIATFFRWLCDLGTRPDQTTSERRRITLTNQCALLATGLFGVFAPISTAARLVLGEQIAVGILIVNGLACAMELLVLWLNARGLTILARYQLVIAANLSNIGVAYLLGVHNAFLYYYFPLVLTPWFLFENSRRFHRGVLAAICFSSFVIIRWVLPSKGFLPTILSGRGLELYELVTVVLVSFLLAMIAIFFTQETARAEALAEAALAQSEQLLLNILPASISARLKTAGRTLADGHGEVTVLFADLVGFTELSGTLPPAEIVKLLNEIFSRFDDLTEQLGLEKIKTIGDAYMVASGLPEPRADHLQAMARMALQMQRTIVSLNAELGRSLGLRIGLHTGPVVAGVIGKRKFIYDLWGDTVNIASRMESSGVPGSIQITREVHDRLGGAFKTERRGTIQVKGKGDMETFFLRGEG